MPATGRKHDIFLLRRNAVPTAWICFSGNKRLLQIRNQLVHMLQSNGQAQQSVGDAELFGTSGWVCFIG